MSATRHILINGLSMGSGGGLTVGRELLGALAMQRPTWQVTLAVITHHPLHEELRHLDFPGNCQLHWAPPQTIRRRARSSYESSELSEWALRNAVDAVVQLNGMVVPEMPAPTLAHMQDPFPYRPEAWTGFRDRFNSLLKRRRHARSLRLARCVSWTSQYLHDLICGALGTQPRCSEILYNGVPTDWIDRARNGLPPWDGRPMELITVSNVAPYKRQDLVIRALALLVRRPGLEQLKYRIVGDCPDSYRAELLRLARQLGVEDRVIIHGRTPASELPGLFAGARCFVLMSLCESFGIPAIEAMSFGTPVITSDCCAMPEVCGAAAELSPVNDAPALAERIERVLKDTERAHELRRRGVERIAQFNWPNTASRMAELLDEVATRPARS